MNYYNATKKYNMPVIGDEPNIIDDNTGDKREIKIECIKFYADYNKISKNKNDNYIIRHRDSTSKEVNDWYSAKSSKTIRGFTTFSSVVALRSAGINITPAIISGSYDYDGETERFEIPLLSPIYSNDNIKCSISNKTSNKNSLSINPESGVIEVSRKV